MSKILVLGDSHADVFKHPRFASLEMEVVTVGGATISGFPNPNSKTQALPRFEKAIRATEADTVLTMMGEVDTGFVIWWRAQKHGSTVAKETEFALGQYKAFLSSLPPRFSCVVCVSCPLPTIDDNHQSKVAHLRREIQATQMERTILALAFNREVEQFCLRQGITFVDLDGASRGPDGLVASDLINPNPLDHHYHQENYADLLWEHLARVDLN